MPAYTSQAKEVRALLAKAADKLEKDRKRCEKSMKIGSRLLTDFLTGVRRDMSGLNCRHVFLVFMSAVLSNHREVFASDLPICQRLRQYYYYLPLHTSPPK